MNNRLEELNMKFREALMRQEFTKANKIQNKIRIELQKKEYTPLNNLLPLMSEKEKEKALTLMHKVFMTADLLYGYALDFESYLNRFDPSLEVAIVKKVKEIANVSRDITRNVDQYKDEKLSEDFGRMCDEASLVLENIIYKYRQMGKNSSKNN